MLNYTEEEARGVFQSGNAVFMRNWPYAWALAQGAGQPDQGQGRRGRAAQGRRGRPPAPPRSAAGSSPCRKYSQNPEPAADLVLYLTSAEEQKRRAIEGAFNPTIAALYKDPEVLAAAPVHRRAATTRSSTPSPRPSTVTGAKYNQVSNAFWNAVHSVLSGKAKAAEAWRNWKARSSA